MTRILAHSVTRQSLAVLAISAALTLVLALPVLRAPSERLIGDEIAGRHHDAYNYIQRFESPPGRHYFTQPATDWPGSLLGLLLGGVVAYNILVLVTFPLTAWATFLLGRRIGLGGGVATWVALLFAFGPFHIAHSAYHPHIAQLQWLPVALLAMLRLLREPRWLNALAFAVSAGVMVAADFYTSLSLLTVFPAGALAYWATSAAADRRRARSGALAVLVALVAFALASAWFLVLFEPKVIRMWTSLGFPLSELSIYAARWWSYLVPPAGHPLLGGWTEAFWTSHPLRLGIVEHQLFLGVALLGLALYGVLRPTPDEEPEGRATRLTLLVVALTAFVFSLAPTLDIAGWHLPRPSMALHALLPMFRAYARLGVVVALGVTLLAGLGLERLLDGTGRRRALGFCAAVLAVFELTPLPPWRWHDVLPTQAHRWLADQEGPLQVVDCVRPTQAQQSITALMPHPTSILGVFTRPEKNDPRRFGGNYWLLRVSRPVGDCAEPGLPGKLAAMGYTHLLSRSSYRLHHLVPAPGLRQVASFDDSIVYAVEAEPAAVYTQRIDGFHWRSTDRHPTNRWMGAGGIWKVVNPGLEPIEAWLSIDLVSFHQPRSLGLRLADRGQRFDIEVGTRWRTYRLGPMRLEPGVQELHFEPAGQPTVPADVSASSDTRPLTLAVGQWTWSVVDDSENSEPAETVSPLPESSPER